MAHESSTSTGGAALWAFSVVALAWDAVAAIVTVVFAFALAPRLPSVVTILFPGVRGALDIAYEVPTGGLTIGLAIGVVAFAVIALVVRVVQSDSARVWLAVILVILSVLVAVTAVTILTSSLFQLDAAEPLTRSDRSWVGLLVATDVVFPVTFVAVLASALFIPRRLTLGVWRAPGRRRTP
ncbi:MAG: hypothetical protein ABIR17_02130 [Pseudolysinimonas sp.]|uniref:hypothetical protein n=1 Tax=Pseudolysinimonas sp. TaxID=2680009 RepID=UPI00326424B4